MLAMAFASISTESPPCADRTSFFPSHTGSHILPNSPIFAQLLRHAVKKRVAIRDLRLGIERSYEKLLSDVLELRSNLATLVDPLTTKRLKNGEEVFVGLLAGGGYEFAVGMLAILAAGAAAVPISLAAPVEEAADLVLRSKQVAILTASSSRTLGTSVAAHVEGVCGTEIASIEILAKISRVPLSTAAMVISADRPQSQDAAGLVIFTSGTTGPPKGVVLRRSFVHDTAVAMIDLYDITHKDVVLHILPVHHVTGIGVTLFPFLYAGARIDFRSGSFEPAWIWERWRRGGLTFFSGVPTMYMRLMRFHDQRISALPQHQRSQYLQGLNNVRVMVCGSSALPQPVQDFWTSLRGGRMILTRYGATEFSLVFRVAANDSEETPDGSVGVAAPGVEVKLSNRNEGEILVRSCFMFARYLSNEEATIAAHDTDGYFRTGDIARRDGPYYWILGRESVDIIKSGGFKISALDIEREILGLSYVSEVMVVGVEDDEYGQRVGAVVALQEDQDTHAADGQGRTLTLDELRRDLRPRLAGYKLPTLLRLWKGDLPKGSSGKVMKKELGSQLFPYPGWEKRPEVQVWKGTRMQLKAKI